MADKRTIRMVVVAVGVVLLVAGSVAVVGYAMGNEEAETVTAEPSGELSDFVSVVDNELIAAQYNLLGDSNLSAFRKVETEELDTGAEPSQVSSVSEPIDKMQVEKQFVERVYLAAQGRQVDPAGQQYWAERFANEDTLVVLGDLLAGLEAEGPNASKEQIFTNLGVTNASSMLETYFIDMTYAEALYFTVTDTHVVNHFGHVDEFNAASR